MNDLYAVIQCNEDINGYTERTLAGFSSLDKARAYMLSAVPIPRDEDICGDIHLSIRPLKLNPEPLAPTELHPNLVLANKYQFDLDDTEIYNPEIEGVAVHPDKLKAKVQDGLITIWAPNLDEALLELNRYKEEKGL